jgi:PAS domain S-box-containing protein
MKSMLIELQKSEERFKDMAVSLPTIIIETGLKGEFQFLNQAGYELFGIPGSEALTGLNLLEFVSPESRDRVKEDFSKIIYGVTPNLNDIPLVRRDGQEINIISKMSIIKHSGIIDGIRWSAIDVKPFMASLFVPDKSFFEKYLFSPREKEIINLMLQGYSRKEMSEKYFISENTVKAHTSSIYSKMNVSSKNEFFDAVKNFQVDNIGHSSFKFSILSKIIKE